MATALQREMETARRAFSVIEGFDEAKVYFIVVRVMIARQIRGSALLYPSHGFSMALRRCHDWYGTGQI